MKKINEYKIYSNLLLLITFIALLYKINYNNYQRNIFSEDRLSIVINLKNITKEKHIFYYDIMKKINSSRNYYYIKTFNSSLKNNLNESVENNTVKIVQSNFPDSIY